MRKILLSLIVIFISSCAQAELGGSFMGIDIDHYYNVIFNDEIISSKNPDDIKNSRYLLDITNEDVRKHLSQAGEILRRAQEVKTKLEVESFVFSLDNDLHAGSLMDDTIKAEEVFEMKMLLSEKVYNEFKEIDLRARRLLFESYIELSDSFYEDLSTSYSQYDQDLSMRELYSKTFEYPHLDMAFLDAKDEDAHLRFCQKYGFHKVSDLKPRRVESSCYESDPTDKQEAFNQLILRKNVVRSVYDETCIPILTDVNTLEGIEIRKFNILESITCENSQNVGERVGSFIEKFNIDKRHVDGQSDNNSSTSKANQKSSKNSSGVSR